MKLFHTRSKVSCLQSTQENPDTSASMDIGAMYHGNRKGTRAKAKTNRKGAEKKEQRPEGQRRVESLVLATGADEMDTLSLTAGIK